ncbi:hypothetical protein [Methanothrix soehngenii]|uniref:hypothetical protein n=1 Tax=Methanothrix soehngenii TaxID=2223 RepID=UPI002A3640C4|nr:hypothetical protein [Methanothrix soehngenii]MDY0412825.1 hypothetical protein [Methanothrix soehngenii]
MSIHKTLPPEELASRHQLAIRYETGKKLDQIEDQIRGIRTAINILVTKEQELQEEKKQLSPKMKEAV